MVDLSESKQRDVMLATQAFYANSNTALRKKVTILEAIRWVAQPIEKNCEDEIEEIERSIRCIEDAKVPSTPTLKFSSAGNPGLSSSSKPLPFLLFTILTSDLLHLAGK